MKMQTCTVLMILFALRSFAIEPDLEKQKKMDEDSSRHVK
jgi:hypothetical protein